MRQEPKVLSTVLARYKSRIFKSSGPLYGPPDAVTGRALQSPHLAKFPIKEV